MARISCRKLTYAAVLVLLANTASTPPTEVAAYSHALELCARGHWLEAESFLGGALAKAAGDSDEVWGMRALYGQVLTARAKFPEALKVLAPDPPAQLQSSVIAVRWYGYRAIALARLKRARAAEINLDRAERLARARQPRMLDEVMKWRGNLAFTAGRQAEGEKYTRDGLRYARRYRHSRTEAELLATLGILHTRAGRVDEGIQLGTAVLALAIAAGDDALTEKTQGNLAWAYSLIGDYENVKAYADAALPLAERIGAARDQIPWQMQVGDLARIRGDYVTALKYYRTGVDLAIRQQHADTGDFIASLAVAQLETGDLKSARKNIEGAKTIDREKRDIDEELRATIVEARIDAAEGDLDKAITKISHVLATAASKTRKWEAEARLAEFCESAGRPTEAEKHFRNALNTADKARQEITVEEFRLPFGALVRETYNEYITFLLSDGRVEEALGVAERSRAQNLEEALKAQATTHRVDPKRIARRHQAVFLSYWLAPTRSYVWTITGTSVEVFTLAPAKTIEQAVDLYSSQLQSLRAGEQSRATGASLYQMLVQPVVPGIPQGSRVIVIPDGRLHALNMETLIDGSSHYWIENVTIQTAASMELLDHPRQAAVSLAMLLMGDPPAISSEFPRLTKAAEEIERVRRHFAVDCKIIKGTDATPYAYENADPGHYGLIHFVAHGTATRQRPLDSAVVLARHGDSYKLYARDILKHSLRAKLVTISSCHGAGTRAYAGEGLVGLAWAFLHAGARQVIAALWEVDDNATPQLMDDLYAGIRAGRDPATALRDAKLKLIRGGTIYRQPRYWAPFVLYSGS